MMDTQRYIHNFITDVLGFQSAPLPFHECALATDGPAHFYKTCNFMTFDLVNIAFYSFIACHLLERLVRLPSSLLSSTYRSFKNEVDRFDWSNRVVALVHAVLSSVLAMFCLLNEPQTWSDAASGYTESYVRVLMISIGYFCYDLLVLVRYYALTGKLDMPMLAHHIICILGINYCVNYRTGLLYCIQLLFTEATTPFLHIRWYLLKMGMGDSLLLRINSIIFYIAFFIFRVLWCFASNVHMYVYRENIAGYPWYLYAPIVLPGVLFVLNTYWFVLITARLTTGSGEGRGRGGKNKEKTR